MTDVSTNTSKDVSHDQGKPVTSTILTETPQKFTRWAERGIYAAAFLLAAAGMFTAAVALGSRELLQVPVVRGTVRTPPLRVGVVPDPAGIRLTWNATASQEGAPAVLQIIDGDNSTTQVLDSSQVAAGSFLYKPVSQTVAFHLSFRGSDGVVDASVQAPEGVFNPLPNSRAGVHSATQYSVDEAAAYDEIPHRQRKRTSDEAAGYDPKKATASKTEPFGEASSH